MRLVPPLILALCACAKAVEVPDVRVISVHRTPGKPMMFFDSARPAEEITAKRQPGGYGLIVSVNVPRAGVTALTERRAELTEAEWRKLLGTVSGRRLLEWNPEPVSGSVADWGEAGLRIAASKDHEPTWIRPLNNAGPPNALFRAMVELARKRFPDAKLYYLK